MMIDMTEKQFKYYMEFICEKRDGEYYSFTIREVCDLLNALHEENQALKSDKTNLHRTMSKDRVRYNQFKDNVFCCLDNKIKLLKDCCMSNEVEILEELREEIIRND